MHLVIERRIDAVPGEDGEADLAERPGEGVGETRSVARIAAEELREIERGDPIILVKLIARMLGEAIGVRLRHLIVFAEILVDGGGVGHGVHATGAVAPSARCSRRPIQAARSITVAA